MAGRYRYFRYKRRKSTISRLRSGILHKQYMKDRGLLRCEICGFFDPTILPWFLLESHHIKRVSDGGGHGIDNRILVCPTHHALADRLSRVHKAICTSKQIMIALIKEHEFNVRIRTNRTNRTSPRGA